MVLTIGVGLGLALNVLHEMDSDRVLTGGCAHSLVDRSTTIPAPSPALAPPSVGDSRATRSQLSSKASARNLGPEHLPSRGTTALTISDSRETAVRVKTELEAASSSFDQAPTAPKLPRQQVRWLAMPTQATAMESLAPSMLRPGLRGRAMMCGRELDDGSVDRFTVVEETPALSGMGRAALWLSSQFCFQPPVGGEQDRLTEIELPCAIIIGIIPHHK